MSQGTASQEHKHTDTSRNERLESIRRVRAVLVERRSMSREHREGSRPEGSSRGKNRGVRITDGRVERHDDVTNSVEVLKPREFAGILMREGSDLARPKAYLFKIE